MITEKEFKERFGFEPQQDDLHRVNCDKAGEAGHLMCGICKHCGQPRFLCSGRCINDGLQQLGLERIGNELFAVPVSDDYPTAIVVLGAQFLRHGINASDGALYIIRERKLDRITFEGKIVHRSKVWEHAKYEAATDGLANSLTAMLTGTIMEMVHSGELIRRNDGVWDTRPYDITRCSEG